MGILADILGGIGEVLPRTVVGFGAGLRAGTFPELAIKEQEAERERLWREEQERLKEAAAMRQMEERLLREREMREALLERELDLKRTMEAEQAKRDFLLGLSKEALFKGTPAGREFALEIAGPYAPIIREYFEGRAPEMVPPRPSPYIDPGLRREAPRDVAVPPTKVPTRPEVGKVPPLLMKEMKVPPEFAAIDYALNAAGVDPTAQREIRITHALNFLKGKLADPAMQIDGKPFVVGGIWHANFKDGSSRPLTDTQGNPVSHVEIKGSGATGWWRIDNFRAMQRAPDAVQMVIPPAEPTDPLAWRTRNLEDAINLELPGAETFKFGEKGQAIVPRGWWGAEELPWGPEGVPTPIEHILRDLGVQYYLDLKVEYDGKEWKVAILSDLAPRYKGQVPDVPVGRFAGEPLKPTPKAVKDHAWKAALDQTGGDKEKARALAVEFLIKSGYDPYKEAEEEVRKPTFSSPEEEFIF